MAGKLYKTRGKVWIYPGTVAAWHFVNVDAKTSAVLKALRQAQGKRKGFGSIPVEATIGKTSWHSSIFPDKRSGTYLLPLKLKVRLAEDISAGDQISFTLRVR
jgi:hypothetical protein